MPGDAATRSLVLPLALALLAGCLASLQTFSLGRVGLQLHSPQTAVFLNVFVAWIVSTAMAWGTGAWLRGVAHMRAVRRVPWWETAVSTLSGGILLLLAAIAPKLGVALVAVGLVCGQSVGGLLADRIGLTTGGRRPASPIRLCAGALAIAAVTLGALGAGHGVRIGLLALAVLAGVGITAVQPCLGRITQATSEPLVTPVLTYTGTILIVTGAFAATGRIFPDGFAVPTPYWLGGLLGIAITLIISRIVGIIGVLRLSLASLSGQLATGVVLDVLEPASASELTVRTFGSIALVAAAVLISGRDRRRPTPRRAPSTAPGTL